MTLENTDIEFLSEEFDKQTNEYVLKFSCSKEIVKKIKEHYGEDYETVLSKEFEAYINSLRENLD